MTQPQLTVQQVENIRSQAIAKQVEDKNDLYACICVEVADDLLHMHEAAQVLKDNIMKIKTR